MELARTSYDRLSPEPYQPITEALDLKKFYALEILRSYILGSEDVALPLHPMMTSRLGLYRFLQIPGGHELLFTNPYGLADKLVEAGRD
ncbi:salicylate esterase [Mycobacterium sherrisii]|uniref:salicylate esterase n=1 Tax=Mycobacterium sherrisii TaxID=243061 RepID=UPI001FD0D248|nr:salicylate esterase [Mycobacterium sherrisii]